MHPCRSRKAAAYTKYLPMSNYRIIDTGDKSPSNIEITSGHGTGLVYRYGKVDLPALLSQQTLRFVYEVISNPNNIDTESPATRQVLGDILLECMQESLAAPDGIIMVGK